MTGLSVVGSERPQVKPHETFVGTTAYFMCPECGNEWQVRWAADEAVVAEHFSLTCCDVEILLDTRPKPSDGLGLVSVRPSWHDRRAE